jgi:hypothetical protein
MEARVEGDRLDGKHFGAGPFDEAHFGQQHVVEAAPPADSRGAIQPLEPGRQLAAFVEFEAGVGDLGDDSGPVLVAFGVDETAGGPEGAVVLPEHGGLHLLAGKVDWPEKTSF